MSRYGVGPVEVLGSPRRPASATTPGRITLTWKARKQRGRPCRHRQPARRVCSPVCSNLIAPPHSWSSAGFIRVYHASCLPRRTTRSGASLGSTWASQPASSSLRRSADCR
eukprot:366404-Chlamydomonas_euryale.AAC.3